VPALPILHVAWSFRTIFGEILIIMNSQPIPSKIRLLVYSRFGGSRAGFSSLMKFLSEIRGAIFVVLFVITPSAALFFWQEREESRIWKARSQRYREDYLWPVADHSATAAESGIIITVSMGGGSSTQGKTEDLPLIVTVKNTSDKSVSWVAYPPCEGFMFYAAASDGRKKAIYPFNPASSPFHSLHLVGILDLAPGKSGSYKMNVPSNLLYLHGRKILASIGDMNAAGSADHFEVFSEPFELPDLTQP
jgi:hypothetical protein